MDKSIIDEHSREYWEQLIYSWIYDEQARIMLIRHFLDGKTYEAIAEELNISRATVYNKITKFGTKLFKHSI